MPIIEMINERPLTMAELKHKLAEIEKRDGELNFRSKKAKEYLDQFTQLKPIEITKIKENIAKLDISRLRDKHIAKIIDINPKDIDGLKITLSGENLTLKPEELNKIFEALKER